MNTRQYYPLYNQLWNGSDDLTIDVDGDGFKEILTYNIIELHIDLEDCDKEMREFNQQEMDILNTESNYNHY